MNNELLILRNSVTCLQCGCVMVSKHRHDYQRCDCDNGTFVDGGTIYIRYGGKDMSKVQVNPVYANEDHSKVREIAVWGNRGKDGMQALKYVPIANMADDHIIAVLKLCNPTPALKMVMENELKHRKENDITVKETA